MSPPYRNVEGECDMTKSDGGVERGGTKRNFRHTLE